MFTSYRLIVDATLKNKIPRIWLLNTKILRSPKNLTKYSLVQGFWFKGPK